MSLLQRLTSRISRSLAVMIGCSSSSGSRRRGGCMDAPDEDDADSVVPSLRPRLSQFLPILFLRFAIGLVLAFYAACWHLARVDLDRLATGLPKIGHWLTQAWPPKIDELPLVLLRTCETVAMAALGTTIAVSQRTIRVRSGAKV